MTPEDRRARWTAIVEKNAARGLPVDENPDFVALIEDWIDGKISLRMIQDRYGQLRNTRANMLPLPVFEPVADTAADDLWVLPELGQRPDAVGPVEATLDATPRNLGDDPSQSDAPGQTASAPE